MVLEIVILITLLIVINVSFVILFLKSKISSIILYIVVLANAILVILLLTYVDPLSFIDAYEPFDFEFFDVFLEILELSAFLAIFCVAFIARAKYPVIGGKGWNVLLIAIIFGCIGMFLDVYGEFVTFDFPIPFHTYKLTTNIFQISGLIGLTLAFLLFYKFSEILFPSSKEKE